MKPATLLFLVLPRLFASPANAVAPWPTDWNHCYKGLCTSGQDCPGGRCDMSYCENYCYYTGGRCDTRKCTELSGCAGGRCDMSSCPSTDILICNCAEGLCGSSELLNKAPFGSTRSYNTLCSKTSLLISLPLLSAFR